MPRPAAVGFLLHEKRATATEMEKRTTGKNIFSSMALGMGFLFCLSCLAIETPEVGLRQLVVAHWHKIILQSCAIGPR